MEIGKLNQRITILEHNTKIDSIGNHKAQWEELFSCWAAVNVKSSSETTDVGDQRGQLSVIYRAADTGYYAYQFHNAQDFIPRTDL